MNATLSAPALVLVVVLGGSVLGGCQGEAAEPSRAAAQPTPSAADPDAADPDAADPDAADPDAAVAANLRQLCDHAQDAFRSGSLDDASQNAALAAELQGMMDVAEPDAAEVLRPLAEASGAIALDGRERAAPRLRTAQDRALDELRRACTAAGSPAWG